MFPKSVLKTYSSLINILSRISDPVAVVLAALFSYGYRFSFSEFDMPMEYRLLVIFSFFCVVLIFPLFNLYASWRGQRLLYQAKTIFFAWGSVVVLIVLVLFSLKVSTMYSRIWLGVWAVSGLVFILVARFAVYSFLQYQRAKGKNVRHVVIVGAGGLGRKAAFHIKESPWTGYKVEAFFDDNSALEGQVVDGVRVEGGIDQVGSYLEKNQIDEIWIALPLRAERRMKDLLHAIRHHLVVIKLLPDIFGFSLLYHSMTEIAGIPVVNISDTPMGGSNVIIKAVEDRVIAAVILLMVAPLMLLIAIAVKITSPGPVFYRQNRVSWNGKEFVMLKFRSMPVDLVGNLSEWGNARSKQTTKIGRFLRRTSLDELPQFINVLKGDMSIVGPRPERTEYVEKFKEEIPGYMQKHMVKAGITGWAQVNGWRGDTCLKTRIEYDLYYIEHWSLWFDIQIIIMTFLRGFFNRNAY
jgi:putative colanic acid biosynthesis UDP-glucose lipid carrier transferase